MSYGKRKGNPNRKPHQLRHVRVHYYVMETEAWKSLGCVERAMYIDIASRYAGPGSNNGRIGYSVRDAAENLHIGKSTAARALEKLEDRGFIVAEKLGAFSLKLKHATEWRLTEFPSDIVQGQLATKEFIHWKPQPKNKTRYLQRDLSVPVAGPVGTCNGTVPQENTALGTCSGTVKPILAPRRYLQRDTYS
jgi:hypothetical protein